MRAPAAYHILDLIPQRQPIVCVDTLLRVESDHAVSTFRIPEDFIFLIDGAISSAGILEHIAQSVAARAGYLTLSENREPSIGFIASFKRVKIHRHPQVGVTLKTNITLVSEALTLKIFDAKVMAADEVVATCRINVVVPE